MPSKRGGGPTSAQKAKAQQAEEMAIEMRRGGAKYRKIAEFLTEQTGRRYGVSGAHACVERAMKKAESRIADAAAEHRKWMAERTLGMIEGLYPVARGGGPGAAHAAAVIKDLDLRLAELMGIKFDRPYGPPETIPIDLNVGGQQDLSRLTVDEVVTLRALTEKSMRKDDAGDGKTPDAG